MRNMTPLITNIQRFSIHDGDGIRTTVFFKGCPLHCTWCHNPETQQYKKQILTDPEKCTGCASCVRVCPQGAVHLEGGKETTDRMICDGCGTCTEYCILNLRETAGKEYEIKNLVKELKKDEIFYEQSGGGVTLSGGEVLSVDMDYIEALAKELVRQGITVTVDTCGHVPYENFQRLLPYVSAFLYDIKAMDSEIHKQYTGVDNTLILENLKKLSSDAKRKAKIYIRIPVIKGVNAEDAEMEAIAGWLKAQRIQASQVNLLPYHNTGSSKYGRLGETYRGGEFETPDKEEIERLSEIFRKAGFQSN